MVRRLEGKRHEKLTYSWEVSLPKVANPGSGRKPDSAKASKEVAKNRRSTTDKLSTEKISVDSESARLAHNETKRRRLRKAKELGLCRDCGKPTIHDQIRCENCAEKERQARRERYAKQQKEPGLCRECKKPSIPGQVRCDGCAEKHRKSRRERYARQQMQRKAQKAISGTQQDYGPYKPRPTHGPQHTMSEQLGNRSARHTRTLE